MIQNLLRVGAAIRKWAALAWVVAVALTVLVNYGISGLFSVAIFGVLVFLTFSREGGREQQDDSSKSSRFAPTYHEQLCDPAYRHTYPWNIYRDRK